MESNSKLYLLVLYIGFLAPFLLRGLTWAMLYVWTKNYPQVVGTCSGHHGQLISQNCVLTKIRAEPPLKKSLIIFVAKVWQISSQVLLPRTPNVNLLRFYETVCSFCKACVICAYLNFLVNNVNK